MTARAHFRTFAGILLTIATTGLVVLASPSVSANAQSRADACAAGTGVTVVVDSSDLGGTTTTGCAPGDPETGRDALSSAGFTAQDSAPGMICAIDSLPDPCPTTFDGSFWSYWHAQPGDAWTSYLVGADASAPVRGEVEGWRYNDGSVGPGSGTATEQGPPAEVETEASGSSQEESSQGDGLVITAVASASLLLLIAAAIVLFVRRRKAQARP
ncbi:hypothetical protein E3O62_11690 [Cryobacterium sp. TMT2-15-1]|uniref:hypothetical protein n=1 Tax=Cryobacterium sp. TMT2-15-1 TaxID=1259246 RepID=UPI00106A4159|nr:hypothetical protein [Cryobacterium sp. TMT2-15-1]TFC57835.1 hypothetical protein E3O62_11690 [Cryobacterium sp. TMT2-15-1]